MTQDELAKTMGKSQSAVANKLRLLGLSENVQNALLNGKISEKHGRTLLMVHDKEEQDRLLKQIIQDRITVRSLENLIKHDNVAEEEISQEAPKTIDIPKAPEKMFEEPSFSVPAQPVAPEPEPQPVQQPEEPRFTPPMPDKMIDFTDVTESLNNQAKRDQEDSIVFETPQNTRPREVSNNNDNFSLNSEPYNTKFINYGEIDRDLEEDDDDDDDPESKLHYTSTPQTTFNDLSGSTGGNSGFMTEDDLTKNNLSDNSNSSLDSLLHINPPKSTIDRSVDQDLPKTKDSYDHLENFDDDDDNDRQEGLISYNDKNNEPEAEKPISVSSTFDENLFKTPTIEDYGRRNKSNGATANSLNHSSYRGALKSELEPKEEEPVAQPPKLPDMEVQGGVNAIREVIRELERRNLEIDTDEMNLENSYQIVIKIKKPSVEE